MTRKFLLPLALLALASCDKKDDKNSEPTVNIAQESYALPGDTLYPEGIVYNSANNRFYTGSVSNGDILSVNAETGEAMMLASGSLQNRSAANGLKLDELGRLWVAGGSSATVTVLDAGGGLVKRWDMAALFGGKFINDCISDGTYMYFTDSKVGQMYRARVGEAAPATMELWLTYGRPQVQVDTAAAATNANGVVVTEDKRYLLMIVSATGKLYRITIADRSIAEVALDQPLTAGDGMLLEGSTLYVCRNTLNTIVPVALSGNYSQGTVGAGFGSNLRFPTTLARAGNYLLVVNGQLNKRATKDPVLPFTVSRVDVR